MARSVSLPVQAVMGGLGLATAILGWVGVISRNWTGIALIVVTAFWLNTVWELHKETQKIHDLENDDDEARYAINVDRITATFSSGIMGNRNYRFCAVVENTASFPLRIELTTASANVNGRGPSGLSEWSVPSHILQPHKTVEVPFPDLTGVTEHDLEKEVLCTGLLRVQRPGRGKHFRCEFDISARPNGFDVDGWPKKWIAVLNKEIEYGEWID